MSLLPTSMVEVEAPGKPPMIVEDWRRELHVARPQLLRDHDVISTILIPIPGLDRDFGIVGIGSLRPRSFAADQVQFLQTVAHILGLAIERNNAGQAALAIENARLIAAVLEERQRLARDLHDSVTQAIYGVTLHAEAANRLLAAGDVKTVAHYLHKLQETAQEALEEMRLLIFELRPPILDQEGLVAALQARLGAVEGRANLQTTFVTEGVARLAPSIEQALYRIAQEALNNALKHARAGHINVSLHRRNSTVILAITDDGIGFDPDLARGRGGLGLRGIEERVAQIGGSLVLRSTPGAGTEVRVEVTV
jgi:signal transduction histidine kinase